MNTIHIIEVYEETYAGRVLVCLRALRDGNKIRWKGREWLVTRANGQWILGGAL